MTRTSGEDPEGSGRLIQRLFKSSASANELGADVTLHVERRTMTRAEARVLADDPPRRFGPPESMTDLCVTVIEVADEPES